jgi:signal transduction histidine kinase
VSDITEEERLGAVAEAVNAMSNLGYMISGIRHELGNPINSIKTAVVVLKENHRQYPPDVVGEFLDRVLSDVARVEALLRDLRSFSMYETPEIHDVNLHAFVEDLLSIVTTDCSRRGIRIRTFLRPDAQWGRLDPRALQHVMLNVLTNAMDAVKDREPPVAIACGDPGTASSSRSGTTAAVSRTSSSTTSSSRSSRRRSTARGSAW